MEQDTPVKKRMGKPPGPNKNGYTVTPEAYHQRVANNVQRFGYKTSKIYKEIMDKQGLTPDQMKKLEENSLAFWKEMQTPALMLAKQLDEYKTFLYAKMMQGMDPTSKDVREWGKLMLELTKEINRLTQVSADKKMDVMSKSMSRAEDIIIDLEQGDEDGK